MDGDRLNDEIDSIDFSGEIPSMNEFEGEPLQKDKMISKDKMMNAAAAASPYVRDAVNRSKPDSEKSTESKNNTISEDATGIHRIFTDEELHKAKEKAADIAVAAGANTLKFGKKLIKSLIAWVKERKESSVNDIGDKRVNDNAH